MSTEVYVEKKMKCFAIVVDGEVAGNYCFKEEDEKWVAIFSSNPIVIPVENPVVEGSIWDGKGFTAYKADTQGQ
jgi:hypothetical protein